MLSPMPSLHYTLLRDFLELQIRIVRSPNSHLAFRGAPAVEFSKVAVLDFSLKASKRLKLQVLGS